MMFISFYNSCCLWSRRELEQTLSCFHPNLNSFGNYSSLLFSDHLDRVQISQQGPTSSKERYSCLLTYLLTPPISDISDISAFKILLGNSWSYGKGRFSSLKMLCINESMISLAIFKLAIVHFYLWNSAPRPIYKPASKILFTLETVIRRYV